MTKYELTPTNNRKSFYGKAIIEDTGTEEVLYSYDTPIIKRDKKTGKLTRLFDGWTATTGNHIISFCGLTKQEFLKLPLNNK